MKNKVENHSGVQELCRKLKLQLEDLSVTIELEPTLPAEEKSRRTVLMEQLKKQLAELSS